MQGRIQWRCPHAQYQPLPNITQPCPFHCSNITPPRVNGCPREPPDLCVIWDPRNRHLLRRYRFSAAICINVLLTSITDYTSTGEVTAGFPTCLCLPAIDDQPIKRHPWRGAESILRLVGSEGLEEPEDLTGEQRRRWSHGTIWPMTAMMWRPTHHPMAARLLRPPGTSQGQLKELIHRQCREHRCRVASLHGQLRHDEDICRVKRAMLGLSWWRLVKGWVLQGDVVAWQVWRIWKNKSVAKETEECRVVV